MSLEIKTRNPIIIVIIVITTLVVAVGVVGVVLLRPYISSLVTQKDTSVPETKPLFSFTGAEDWTQGPSNDTSMALFGKKQEDNTSACFVSIEYKAGVVDSEKELDAQEQSFDGSGSTMTQIGTATAILQTNEGAKGYTVYQYHINGTAGGEALMEGLELGYLQLDGGYVKVDGHCETADELPTTLPALQAYKIDK